MKQEERLFDLLGQLPDEVLAQTEVPKPKRRISPAVRNRWIGVAAAACLMVAFVGWGMTAKPYYARDDSITSNTNLGLPGQNIGDPDSVPTQNGGNVLDPAVSGERIKLDWPASGGSMQEAARIFTNLPINGRMAEYHRIDPNSIPRQFRPSTLGAPYGEDYEGLEGWYLPAGAAGLQYLVHREADGSYTLWEFACFTVWDQEERAQVAWSMEHEPDFLWADVEWFSPETMNFDPYPYREVLESIYGIASAEDLTSITVDPANMDNTDEGKKLQKEIGVRTVTDRESLQTFYDAVVDMTCYGIDHWEMIDRGPGGGDGLLEQVRTGRYLTVETVHGTFDTLKYTAAGGQFYEYDGIAYGPLDTATAEKMNEIFRIEVN